jgi:hypothetical protein
MPVPLKRAATLRLQRVDAGKVGGKGRQRLLQVGALRRIQPARAPGAQPAAAEAVAAQALAEVDDGGAQTAIGAAALQEGDVGGQSVERGHMHGDALQLQRHAAQQFGLQAGFHSAECFDGGAMAPGVGHGGIATHRLDQRRQRKGWAAQQQGLDAAVLVAQLDFQVVHLLAQAHEAEVAGLDDAGVDRAHTHLMHLLAAHAKEGVFAHALLAFAFKADRLEPGVALGLQTGLLPQLPLLALRRRELGGKRRVGVAALRLRPQHRQCIARSGLKHGGYAECAGGSAGVRPPEQHQKALARGQARCTLVGENRQRQRWQLAQVAQQHGRVHVPPIERATALSSCVKASGV